MSRRALATGLVAALTTVTVAEEWTLDLSLLEELDLEPVCALLEPVAEPLAALGLEWPAEWPGEYTVDLAAARATALEIAPWLSLWLDAIVLPAEVRIIVPPLTLALPPAPVPPLELPPAITAPPVGWWTEQLQGEPLSVRADFYAPHLKPLFAAEGVPAELVWLAEVESGFNAHARSPVGAAGLFQLMPETADWLGLALEPVDERYDPLQNASAAARYLRYLYRQFGDWPLAVAAYNGGEGRVRRLLAAHNARRFEEIAGYLPAETRLYVPKVAAAIQRREGVALPDLPAPAIAGGR